MEKSVATNFRQETGVAFLYNLRWDEGRVSRYMRISGSDRGEES
jgi:hypothetical protein